MRERGYYWVVSEEAGVCQVAWWGGVFWNLCGTTSSRADSDFHHIDERQIKRDDVVLSEEDCAVLLQAIEKPPKPSERLKELLARQPPRSAT